MATLALRIAYKGRRAKQRNKEFEVVERVESHLEIERKVFAGSRIAAIQTPFDSIRENSPAQSLRFIKMTGESENADGVEDVWLTASVDGRISWLLKSLRRLGSGVRCFYLA